MRNLKRVAVAVAEVVDAVTVAEVIFCEGVPHKAMGAPPLRHAPE
jgi:hypothetical protein